MSLKPPVFVLTAMVSLLVIVVSIISLAAGSWVPLIGTAIGLGISAVIAAIEVPLLIWASKRWDK
jgi:CHASE2 domain-containing sensor protein